MKTYPTKINGKAVSAATILLPYTLLQKASTNVAYFGINKVGKLFFAQYSNGSCYQWKNVPVEVLEQAETCNSIGSFIHKHIKGHEREELAPNLIEEPADESFEIGSFNPEADDDFTSLNI